MQGLARSKLISIWCLADHIQQPVLCALIEAVSTIKVYGIQAAVNAAAMAEVRKPISLPVYYRDSEYTYEAIAHNALFCTLKPYDKCFGYRWDLYDTDKCLGGGEGVERV